MPKPGYLFILPWELQRIGGVNQIVSNLMHQLEIQQQFRPMLMVQSWEDRRILLSKPNESNFYKFRLRQPWSHDQSLKTLAGFLLELPITLLRLRRFIRKENIAVINLHYPTLSGMTFVLMKKTGLFSGKLIISVHGSDIMNAKNSRGITRYLWKIFLRKADWVVSCSVNLSQEVLSFCAKSRSVPILNGINPAQFLRGMDVGYIPDPRLIGARYILNVAAFEPKKGQDTLLHAFTKVSEIFPDILLVMVGQVGPAYDNLMSLVKTLGLSNRVLVFTNMPHERVASLMSRATLFTLPSRIEPFGIVLLEAGFFSLPVVTTKIGGIPEIITHGINGILVDPDDSVALAKEIMNLLENTTLGAKLGKNLNRDVMSKFTFERVLHNYLELLH
jgi:glycosyltransferase involved in cell wall biosynthesis